MSEPGKNKTNRDKGLEFVARRLAGNASRAVLPEAFLELGIGYLFGDIWQQPRY